MTQQTEQRDPDAAPGEPAADRPARRSRTLRRALAVLVTIALLVVLAWYGATSRAADQVLIRWADENPTCTGTTVRPATTSDDRTLPGSRPRRLVAVDGMACSVTVEVLNRSGRTIHLDRAVADYVGPDTGTVVTIDPRAHPGAGADIDATLPLDETVEPSGVGSFTIHLVFNPDGCNDSGTLTVDAWPRVTYSVLGRSFTRPAADTFAFQHRGRTPGCRGS